MRSSSTERAAGPRGFWPLGVGAWTRLSLVVVLGAGALVTPATGVTGAIYTDRETVGFDVVPSIAPAPTATAVDTATPAPTDTATAAVASPAAVAALAPAATTSSAPAPVPTTPTEPTASPAPAPTETASPTPSPRRPKHPRG